MSILNHEARAQYQTHDEHGTVYGKATNECFDAIRDVAIAHGLRVPNDDAAENLVTQIFCFLWDNNNRS